MKLIKNKNDISFLKTQSLPLLNFPYDLELGVVEITEDEEEDTEQKHGSMVAKNLFQANLLFYAQVF